VAGDKYDERAFCGPRWLTTSLKDPFNRVCAAHDSAFKKGMYGLEKANQLMKDRMPVYQWLYHDDKLVQARRRFYSGAISLLGGWFWLY